MGGRAPQFDPFGRHQGREVVSADEKHDGHWRLSFAIGFANKSQ